MKDVVLVRSYLDPEEAYVVRSALEAADINVILFGDSFCTNLPHLRLASGGYRLSVPASQESAAREALAEIESVETAEPIGADAPCAACDGRLFRRERSWRWAIIAFFFESAFAAQSGRSRCLSCGAVVDNDRRPLVERSFFFLCSMAILVWIAWPLADSLYGAFAG